LRKETWSRLPRHISQAADPSGACPLEQKVGDTRCNITRHPLPVPIFVAISSQRRLRTASTAKPIWAPHSNSVRCKASISSARGSQRWAQPRLTWLGAGQKARPPCGGPLAIVKQTRLITFIADSASAFLADGASTPAGRPGPSLRRPAPHVGAGRLGSPAGLTNAVPLSVPTIP